MSKLVLKIIICDYNFNFKLKIVIKNYDFNLQKFKTVINNYVSNLKIFKTIVINYDLIRTPSFRHFFSMVLDCYFHFILSIILR